VGHPSQRSAPAPLPETAAGTQAATVRAPKLTGAVRAVTQERAAAAAAAAE